MSDLLRERARALGLWGVLANWEAVGSQPWLGELVALEESERQRRSFERRLHHAHLGSFKAMADFDWSWPSELDRAQVEELMSLRFVRETTNAILVGPNGLGKTMVARNLAYQALVAGYSVKFLSASELLADLGSCEGMQSLRRRLKHYARYRLLVIDELGYLSYDDRAADLLFEVVNARYGHKPLVLTTNRRFSEWSEVFPNATCVVTLVDRLVHNAEIVKFAGESYRLKEAREKAAERAEQRAHGSRPGRARIAPSTSEVSLFADEGSAR